MLIDGDGLASGRTFMNRKPDENYSEKEATARFEAALKSALNTPHKPLKEKPRVKKAAKKNQKNESERIKLCVSGRLACRALWSEDPQRFGGPCLYGPGKPSSQA